MGNRKYNADVVIAGGGLAGLITALELVKKKKKVIIIERDYEENLGGLAKESFGGIFSVGTPQQKRAGFKDSVELAIKDWFSAAEFSPENSFGKKWAKFLIENSKTEIYDYLRQELKISFIPSVHWVERGLFVPGNSVPRFHIIWGTGLELINKTLAQLQKYKKYYEILFRHKAETIISQNGKPVGIEGINEETLEKFTVKAEAVVVATGGISGGDLSLLRKHWYKPWGEPPEYILNGSHKFADGAHLEMLKPFGAKTANLDLQWNYAAGIHHPSPKRHLHGISLVPPKSALWLNYKGIRFKNPPLITAFDTRFLVETIAKEPVKYSWQVMNYKIAIKELAVSGAEFNPAIRDKKWIQFAKTLLRGNKKLVDYLLKNSKDIVEANTIEELANKMNELTGKDYINPKTLREELERYDENVRRKNKSNDDQIRRILHARKYLGDKLRTLKYQPIYDEKALPLIAIREFIISRKSLGGIVTDLHSRVINTSGEVIPGLYCVGESAGFGGGGIHGKRSLEGTFLAACILTGKQAGKDI